LLLSAESESRAFNHGQTATLLIHKNGSGAATKNSSETGNKHKMLRIEPRLAFINGVLLANRVLIFRFQLLAVYVLRRLTARFPQSDSDVYDI
jgi:hypothetical protein